MPHDGPGTCAGTGLLVSSCPPPSTAEPAEWRHVVLVVLGEGSVPGLAPALVQAGFAVEPAADIVEARRLLTRLGEGACVVIDAPGLPPGVQASLAALSRQVAVVVCTRRETPGTRIALLQEGADLVLSTPYADEVVASLAAVLRRAATVDHEPPAEVLVAGDLSVHLAARVATVAGRALRLTSLEFDLLAYFLARPGRSITRERLLRDVWGYDVGGLDTVTVHVRRLRTKIEEDPSRPAHLQTVWGVGYRLAVDTAAACVGDELPSAAAV
jgi:DNA-binding response OmpR family regulator